MKNSCNCQHVRARIRIIKTHPHFRAKKWSNQSRTCRTACYGPVRGICKPAVSSICSFCDPLSHKEPLSYTPCMMLLETGSREETDDHVLPDCQWHGISSRGEVYPPRSCSQELHVRQTFLTFYNVTTDISLNQKLLPSMQD